MKVVPIILGFLFTSLVLGQNLVKNPSFEDYLKCPNALGTFGSELKHWSIPTQGSTDYFNTCSKVMSAPENFNGIQHPKSGNAYAGFYFYAPADYREYIQVELKRKLQKDKKYHLEFYVSLAEGSDFAVKDFGVVFSYKPVEVKTKKNLSKGRLYQVKGNRFQTLEINHSDFHEDKSIWLRIQTTFTAKGFERYLILGNLRDNKSTRKVRTKRKETKKGAYYYIDQVSLTSDGKDIPIEAEIATDTLFAFQNVHFDFDKFSLTSEAKKELVIIQQQLENNEDLHLEIHGHTDDQGTHTYNQALSEKRAKAIADYFIEVGISPRRITWRGHGSKKPLVVNSSEQARAKNRRVEFLLNTAN
jgi:outer membrane protein OmpA-like peptidoglycan-associated protein